MLVSCIITSVSSIIGIAIWVYWSILARNRWRYAVAPISYFVHVLLFYLAVIYYYLAHGLSPQFLNVWSNGIRLHGILLLIGVAFLLVCKIRGECPKWMLPK